MTEFNTRAPKAIEAGKKPADWSITCKLPLPEEPTLQDIITMCEDEKTVIALAMQQLVIRAQSFIRTLAEAGKTDDEIQKAMTEWKPGTATGVKADPLVTFQKNLGNMTEEQIQNTMRLLKERMAEAKKA